MWLFVHKRSKSAVKGESVPGTEARAVDVYIHAACAERAKNLSTGQFTSRSSREYPRVARQGGWFSGSCPSPCRSSLDRAAGTALGPTLGGRTLWTRTRGVSSGCLGSWLELACGRTVGYVLGVMG
jgi:hypothetical protein